ncbi:MAG: alcohol dehydrogenase catalytic domain-containing protein [Firmicutes bacterium]|jgi:D-arabinose 1-dehydrogenase-like Zn-dependent alcohol dehydrogenase|nr:alcohol dehydrogenase catalytic domain-containing protein [Bacillota bacterium]MDH7496478.1 alcohol dehydrogenase catalytic domain-containing protein [Bacillota bacterium]
MKAVRLVEIGQPLRLEELDRPACGPGEVLVSVRAAGVCGTDLKLQAGKIPLERLPVTLGHEFSGVIVEKGALVEGFGEGDEVLISFYVPCNTCKWCLAGRHTICENLKGRLGFELDGGLAEFVAVPASCLVRKPPTLSFEEAAIVSDAVATPYHALRKRAAVAEGDATVVVGGGGGLGLHAIQIAKSLRNVVIGLDASSEKLRLMRTYGADEVIDVRENPDWGAAIRELTGGRGADNAIDFVSSVETVRNGIVGLRKGGKLVLVAYSADLRVDSLKAVLSELDVMGSRAATKRDIEECLGLIAKGEVKPVIGEVLPFEEANKALSMLREGTVNGRVVLRVSH